MLVLKITIRFLSDSHQIPIRSTSDSLQIPIRSLSDSFQIPIRSLSDTYQIPIRFLPLWICKDVSWCLMSCKDGPHLQASSDNLILVLKLPLLLGGYDALEVIRHLCTAHQDLKKVALVNRMDNKKTALWAALQIYRSPCLWPLSPLWISKDFYRCSRSCNDGPHLQASSANLMLVLKITIRSPSYSHHTPIISHQIPFRSPSDSYQIPFRFPSEPHQIPIIFPSDSYLSGFERIPKGF